MLETIRLQRTRVFPSFYGSDQNHRKGWIETDAVSMGPDSDHVCVGHIYVGEPEEDPPLHLDHHKHVSAAGDQKRLSDTDDADIHHSL